MLFDFHHQETSKKPGSVHATYLLSGIRRPPDPAAVNGSHAKDGDDDYMQSSPFMSSSMPNQDEAEESVSIRCITLVKEENLQGKTDIAKLERLAEVKAQYEKIASVHIYSLEPSSLKDLQVLSDSNRQISVKYASEDPFLVCTQYGTITNPNVKRRTGRRPPPPAATLQTPKNVSAKAPAKPQGSKGEEDKKQSQGSAKPSSEKKPQEQSAPKSVAAKNERRSSTDSKLATKPSSLKRDKSDIFKSFAKSKASLKKEDTGSSAGASPAPSVAESVAPTAAEDEPMKDASEDEQEEDDTPEISSKEREAERQSKLERQQRLKKMMDDDDDDEPMQDVAAGSTVDEGVTEDGKLAESQEVKAEEPTVTVSGGRRRGKRRVMKKKTVKDDEGYLVTREEPGWESFSEEEPKPQKPKTPAPTSSASSKAKKSGGKPGQGNLMSFFSKK
ncbi:MAG: hypothetical protein M1812_000839 [Candelaria pacifica]|nr:MAG: hypothetical protein M1812_000839 [Candelaria pacifica]